MSHYVSNPRKLYFPSSSTGCSKFYIAFSKVKSGKLISIRKWIVSNNSTILFSKPEVSFVRFRFEIHNLGSLRFTDELHYLNGLYTWCQLQVMLTLTKWFFFHWKQTTYRRSAALISYWLSASLTSASSSIFFPPYFDLYKIFQKNRDNIFLKLKRSR